jgi:glutathione S-transferase
MPPQTASTATLVISSRNYSSWSLRGWLLVRLSGLAAEIRLLESGHAIARAELLQQTASTRIPYLEHAGLHIWDVLAIAEYLHEVFPESGMMPADRAARARSRAISGEMHAGFATLRASLPVNLRARHRNFPIWSGVRADIDRITEIWRECLEEWGGPYLFGARPGVADAMYAPVCTRFQSYGVALDPASTAYTAKMLAWDPVQNWFADAATEADEMAELDLEVEF